MRLLEGKVILITGSGGGVGRAHAHYLASQGARIVVNDLGASVTGEGADAGPAQNVAAEIIAAGGEAVANTDDISNWQGARRAVHEGIEAFGRLDGLVNNAGSLRRPKLHEMTEEDFDLTVAVHLKGGFACSVHACNYWQERFQNGDDPRAAIVNTISDAMIVGLDRSAIYAGVKAGIAQLTINGSREALDYGVRINAYGPRAFTRMSTASYKNAGTPDESRPNPKDPVNASPLVAWLLSDRSPHVTGQIFQTIGGGIAHCQPLTAGPIHWPEDGEVRFSQEEIEPLINGRIFGCRFPDLALQEPPGWVASF